MGVGSTCAVAMLVIFNIIAGLAGAAILAIGVWMLVDDTIVDKLELIKVVSEDDMLQTAAIILCAVGGFALIVALLGCCGAIRKSKCLLGIYAFVLFIVIAGEIVGGVLAVIYRQEVEDKLETEGTKKIRSDELVMVNDDDELEYTAFGLALSIAQEEWECCGIVNVSDYTGSEFVKDNREKWTFLPTCCDTCETCDGVPERDPNKVSDTCKDKAKSGIGYYENGCVDEIKDWFEEKALILAGIAIAIGCVEIFGFIFAICLCRSADDDN